MIKRILTASIFLLLLFFATAETTPSSTWELTAEGGFYPFSQPISGDTHFAALTGLYDSAEFRVVSRYTYTIPVLFGDHPLVCGNSVRLKHDFEITPVSLATKGVVAFSPVAFLDFSAGGYIGTGWDFIGIHGLALFDRTKNDYTAVSPFSTWRYDLWAEGLFQFDVAAIYPGDWHHVVTVASYAVCWKGVTGAGENKDIWKWQGTGEQVNGFQYTVTALIGYQMPLFINTVGILTTWKGYYSEHVFQNRYRNWNPTFCEIDINPLVMMKFDEHNSLTVLLSIKSRRSYERSYDSDDILFDLPAIGREWFFNRIAFSYTYRF